MCTVVLAYQCHTTTPVLLLANRDEVYARPTKACHAWGNASGIVAPQDRLSGGSNIGINRYGQWIALTNYRAPTLKRDDVESRGLIAARYLSKAQSAQSFVTQLPLLASSTNPFNVLLGDYDAVFYYSSVVNKAQLLTPGYYGLSNADLDTPWPKVTRLKSQFITLMQQPFTEAALWKLMQDKTLAIDSDLPETGIPYSAEKALSALFVDTPDYGTRASYLLRQQQHTLTLDEKIYR